METEEIQNKFLKFKKARTGINYCRKEGVVYLMADGYRLATVKEVEDDWKMVKSQGFETKMRLLDGYINKEPACFSDCSGYLSLSSNHVIKKTFAECDWEILVKEKERDNSASPWKKNKSACYELSGMLMRRHLYDNISLSPEGKRIALALASIHGDSEVLYWLVRDKDLAVFEDFKTFFMLYMSKLDRHSLFLPSYSKMVESLLISNFPLTLSTEYDNPVGPSVVDYAIKSLHFGDPNDSGILIFELLIEMYNAESIISHKTEDGKSLMDLAIKDAEDGGNAFIPIMAKLLSECLQFLNIQTLKRIGRYEDVLFVAVKRGYCDLVEELLKNESFPNEITSDTCQKVAREAVLIGCKRCVENVLNLLEGKYGHELQRDKYDKTLFHYAGESGNTELFDLLAKTYKSEYRKIKRDTRGRNFLHWAALNGQAETCRECITEWKLDVRDEDGLGQNSLHFSAKGKKGHQIVNILIDLSEDLINSRDFEGRTPLHFACAKGNLEWVEAIKSISKESIFKKCIKQPDGHGRTALQLAAGGGHKQLVQKLLDQDCDPLLQRDLDGCTALHYAAQVKDAEVAVAISRCLLNKYGDGSDKRSLLLWTSAAGIGTADESKDASPYVKQFLLQEKKISEEYLLQGKIDENYSLQGKNTLLRAAARNNNVEMAWELLNRGANIKDILDSKWRLQVANIDIKGPELRDNVNNVINQIAIERAQGPDRPSLEDNLGRNAFAEGLASLFLNKFIESPITVGIFGEWGMGKSSLMYQTESILLLAASQLAFPNLLRSEKFLGAEKISLKSKGQNIYWKMKKGVSKLLAPSEDMSEKRKRNALVEVLEKYHPEYHAVYKSLACMDVDNQMLCSDVDGKSPFLPMRRVPRILTIQYNAWHYRDEHEAWAGLAVTITKEIEQAMTRAQRLGTCWKYSWDKNKVNICIQIFLPFLLVIVLSGWIVLVVWTLLREAKFKNLKYGSIPFTIIAISWGVLKSLLTVVKPVSTQMMGYINSPDHTARLGYQQQVISDIKFLKNELGKRPHWFFPLICGEWCWNWFGKLCDNVENTSIPKFSPASIDQLRMITFVDDLDRCDDKVILQVLTAINLVLAECKINVIMGIDKKVIERAVKKHFEDNEDRDLVEKFICKIIQIPLSLPDPTKIQSERFLAHLLGHQPSKMEDADQEGEDPDYGDLDTDNDVDDNENAGQRSETQQSRVDIDTFDEPPTSCDGIIGKVCQLLAHKLSSKEELNDREIHPLTFSKGARLTREMVLSNYTEEEIDILYKLRDFATGNQKLPREWKLILTYRKLACNILSIIGEVRTHPNWKVELVAWIFICWQWKLEMNILIKGWKKHADVNMETKGKSKVGQDEDRSSCKSKDKSGPSLKQIVFKYIRGFDKSQANQNNGIDRPQQNQDIEGHLVKANELVKLKDCLGLDLNLKAILFMYDHNSKIDDEVQTKYNWLNLLEALKVQDITMEGIQLFQQFRLHCENDHLSWPLPESVDSKYERLTSSVQKI